MDAAPCYPRGASEAKLARPRRAARAALHRRWSSPGLTGCGRGAGPTGATSTATEQAQFCTTLVRGRGSSRCSRRWRSTRAHPFPHISNLSPEPARVRCWQRRKAGEDQVRPACKVPPIFARFVPCSADADGYRPARGRSSARTCKRCSPGMEILELHPFRVTRNERVRDRGGRRGEPARRASRRSCCQRAGSASPVRLEVEESDAPTSVLDLLVTRARGQRRGRLSRLAGPARPARACCGIDGLRTARSCKYAAFVPHDASAARRGRVVGTRRRAQGDPPPRHPAAPPLRLVRDPVERFIEQAAARPEGAGDQADALPHRRRLPDRRRAAPRRRDTASR